VFLQQEYSSCSYAYFLFYRYLAKLLNEQGYKFHTSAEMEVVKRIKHKACQTAFVLRKTEKEFDDIDELPGINKSINVAIASSPIIIGFKLPDGKVIKIGLEKFKAPELMFKPSLLGLKYPGVHEITVNAVAKCATDIRRQVFSQILLAVSHYVSVLAQSNCTCIIGWDDLFPWLWHSFIVRSSKNWKVYKV